MRLASPYIDRYEMEREFSKDGTITSRLVIYANIPLSGLEKGFDEEKVVALIESLKPHMQLPDVDTVTVKRSK